MNFYVEGQIIEMIIPFQDKIGNEITPTHIAAILYDGEGDVLMDFGSIAFDVAERSTRLIIPAALNVLSGDDEEARRLQVMITHTYGAFSVSQIYAVEPEESLRIMSNSFMTKETAEMLLERSVNLTTLKTASEISRVAALAAAFRKIVGISMIVRWTDSSGVVTSEVSLNTSSWENVTSEDFATFPDHFKRALRSAQLIEADELLQGNVVARKHAQGIASETIGESSVTFRQGFAGLGSSDISTSAQSVLSGYIDRSVRIGRA